MMPRSPFIDSPDNPRIKAAARLRTRRGRATQGRIVIDGVREVLRALESGAEIVAGFARQSQLPHKSIKSAWSQLEATAAETFLVSDRAFQKLAFGDRDEGILAVARPPQRSLVPLAAAEQPLILVLDGLEKPGNIGAIFRTADAVGVAGVIVCGSGTDPYNPNAIRASLGTVFTTPAFICSGEEARCWLRSNDFQVVAARTNAPRDYCQLSYAGRTAIVLGSEATGLTGAWQSDNVLAVSLPMHGAADSLNVSVTAAVLCYEALRQRSRSEGAS